MFRRSNKNTPEKQFIDYLNNLKTSKESFPDRQTLTDNLKLFKVDIFLKDKDGNSILHIALSKQASVEATSYLLAELFNQKTLAECQSYLNQEGSSVLGGNSINKYINNHCLKKSSALRTNSPQYLAAEKLSRAQSVISKLTKEKGASESPTTSQTSRRSPATNSMGTEPATPDEDKDIKNKLLSYCKSRFQALPKEGKDILDVNQLKTKQTIFFISPKHQDTVDVEGKVVRGGGKDLFTDFETYVKENNIALADGITFFSFVNDSGSHWSLKKIEYLQDTGFKNPKLITCKGDGACGAHAIVNTILKDETLKNKPKIIEIARLSGVDLTSEASEDMVSTINFIGLFISHYANTDKFEVASINQALAKLSNLRETRGTNPDYWLTNEDLEIFTDACQIMHIGRYQFDTKEDKKLQLLNFLQTITNNIINQEDGEELGKFKTYANLNGIGDDDRIKNIAVNLLFDAQIKIGKQTQQKTQAEKQLSGDEQKKPSLSRGNANEDAQLAPAIRASLESKHLPPVTDENEKTRIANYIATLSRQLESANREGKIMEFAIPEEQLHQESKTSTPSTPTPPEKETSTDTQATETSKEEPPLPEPTKSDRVDSDQPDIMPKLESDKLFTKAITLANAVQRYIDNLQLTAPDKDLLKSKRETPELKDKLMQSLLSGNETLFAQINQELFSEMFKSNLCDRIRLALNHKERGESYKVEIPILIPASADSTAIFYRTSDDDSTWKRLLGRGLASIEDDALKNNLTKVFKKYPILIRTEEGRNFAKAECDKLLSDNIQQDLDARIHKLQIATLEQLAPIIKMSGASSSLSLLVTIYDKLITLTTQLQVLEEGQSLDTKIASYQAKKLANFELQQKYSDFILQEKLSLVDLKNEQPKKWRDCLAHIKSVWGLTSSDKTVGNLVIALRRFDDNIANAFEDKAKGEADNALKLFTDDLLGYTTKTLLENKSTNFGKITVEEFQADFTQKISELLKDFEVDKQKTLFTQIISSAIKKLPENHVLRTATSANSFHNILMANPKKKWWQPTPTDTVVLEHDLQPDHLVKILRLTIESLSRTNDRIVRNDFFNSLFTITNPSPVQPSEPAIPTSSTSSSDEAPPLSEVSNKANDKKVSIITKLNELALLAGIITNDKLDKKIEKITNHFKDFYNFMDFVGLKHNSDIKNVEKGIRFFSLLWHQDRVGELNLTEDQKELASTVFKLAHHMRDEMYNYGIQTIKSRSTLPPRKLLNEEEKILKDICVRILKIISKTKFDSSTAISLDFESSFFRAKKIYINKYSTNIGIEELNQEEKKLFDQAFNLILKNLEIPQKCHNACVNFREARPLLDSHNKEKIDNSITEFEGILRSTKSSASTSRKIRRAEKENLLKLQEKFINACINNNLNEVKLCLAESTKLNKVLDFNPALLEACQKNHQDIAKHLADNYPDGYAIIQNGNKPPYCLLSIACTSGNAEIVSYLLQKYPAIKDQFNLKFSFNINGKQQELTPLEYARSSNNAELAEILLQSSTDLTKDDEDELDQFLRDTAMKEHNDFLERQNNAPNSTLQGFTGDLTSTDRINIALTQCLYGKQDALGVVMQANHLVELVNGGEPQIFGGDRKFIDDVFNVLDNPDFKTNRQFAERINQLINKCNNNEYGTTTTAVKTLVDELTEIIDTILSGDNEILEEPRFPEESSTSRRTKRTEDEYIRIALKKMANRAGGTMDGYYGIKRITRFTDNKRPEDDTTTKHGALWMVKKDSGLESMVGAITDGIMPDGSYKIRRVESKEAENVVAVKIIPKYSGYDKAELEEKKKAHQQSEESFKDIMEENPEGLVESLVAVWMLGHHDFKTENTHLEYRNGKRPKLSLIDLNIVNKLNSDIKLMQIYTGKIATAITEGNMKQVRRILSFQTFVDEAKSAGLPKMSSGAQQYNNSIYLVGTIAEDSSDDEETKTKSEERKAIYKALKKVSDEEILQAVKAVSAKSDDFFDAIKTKYSARADIASDQNKVAEVNEYCDRIKTASNQLRLAVAKREQSTSKKKSRVTPIINTSPAKITVNVNGEIKETPISYQDIIKYYATGVKGISERVTGDGRVEKGIIPDGVVVGDEPFYKRSYVELMNQLHVENWRPESKINNKIINLLFPRESVTKEDPNPQIVIDQKFYTELQETHKDQLHAHLTTATGILITHFAIRDNSDIVNDFKQISRAVEALNASDHPRKTGLIEEMLGVKANILVTALKTATGNGDNIISFKQIVDITNNILKNVGLEVIRKICDAKVEVLERYFAGESINHIHDFQMITNITKQLNILKESGTLAADYTNYLAERLYNSKSRAVLQETVDGSGTLDNDKLFSILGEIVKNKDIEALEALKQQAALTDDILTEFVLSNQAPLHAAAANSQADIIKILLTDKATPPTSIPARNPALLATNTQHCAPGLVALGNIMNDNGRPSLQTLQALASPCNTIINFVNNNDHVTTILNTHRNFIEKGDKFVAFGGITTTRDGINYHTTLLNETIRSDGSYAIDFAKYLIGCGSYFIEETAHGSKKPTPVIQIAFDSNKSNLVPLLIRRGADISKVKVPRDPAQQKIWQDALDEREIFKKLTKLARKETPSKSKNEFATLYKKALETHPQIYQSIDDEGNTLLHIAMASGNKLAITSLLSTDRLLSDTNRELDCAILLGITDRNVTAVEFMKTTRNKSGANFQSLRGNLQFGQATNPAEQATKSDNFRQTTAPLLADDYFSAKFQELNNILENNIHLKPSYGQGVELLDDPFTKELRRVHATHPDFLRQIFEQKTNNGQNLLHLAVIYNLPKAVEFLLEKGPKNIVNKKVANGNDPNDTPLHLVLKSHKFPQNTEEFNRSELLLSKRIIKALVDHGANTKELGAENVDFTTSLSNKITERKQAVEPQIAGLGHQERIQLTIRANASKRIIDTEMKELELPKPSRSPNIISSSRLSKVSHHLSS